MKEYRHEKLKEISFPLGGIGAGCIGLAGNGCLRDWEIFNHPYKKTSNGFSHIMVRAEKNNEVIDTRVLHGDWPNSAIGGETANIFRGNGGFGYGMGPYRGTMAGVPHFEDCSFYGEYPFSKIKFRDRNFPGIVELEAFSPFIPLNDKDSSLPAAFFEVVFHNNTQEAIEYTVFFTLNNSLPYGTTVNKYEQSKDISLMLLQSDSVDEQSLLFGNLCLATDEKDISYQEYWYRSIWFDSLVSFWEDVNAGGKLKNRTYPGPTGEIKEPLKMDGEEHATLAVHCTLEAGQTKRVRYIVSWYFPNCANTWNPEKEWDNKVQWRNYYASLFNSSKECVVYCLENWDRLYEDTKLFKETLYRTSLPDYCLEAVSANLSTLKSATCLRLENGEFYGFEGSGMTEGVCEGSCSHVWNYAYALPFLFPKLERSMRDLDFLYNQREDGAMSFRLMLPLGRERQNFRACVDGQMGGVIKAWRDYLLCGDKEWLQKNWNAIKKSIEFAWAPTNEDQWDADKDGVLEGRQHHTLDMELFGPNSWLNGFYLAALLAGSKIAEELGYEDEAKTYLELYRKGYEWCNKHLFNGEYFQQIIDLEDKKLLEKYDEIPSIEGQSALDAYWNEEKGQIKYQIAEGCAADQVVAQWHANLCNLGDIFDKEKVRSSLKAIYKYNRFITARNYFNAGRVYCLDDESGLAICVWPDNVEKPRIPLTYANEVFCGIEYQVASHMIQEGMLDEGFSIVKAIRDRFDGEKRNPWNEFECGNNYARSMASYALIPAISGFSYNLAEGYIGFNPQDIKDEFYSFFSLDSCWGEFSIIKNRISLKVLYGTLELSSFGLPEDLPYPNTIKMGDEEIPFKICDQKIFFDYAITLERNQELYIECN